MSFSDFNAENKFQDELIATAAAIVAPGKGILASDESTGTIGKRLAQIGLENNRENRRSYRHLLFTTKGLGEFISAAILYEETLFEETDDEEKTKFVDLLKAQNIIPGIKVDMGTRAMPGYPGDMYTQGFTDLDKRCARYYEAGARFAKWRNVIKIHKHGVPEQVIRDCAATQARYAAICQRHGLAPIVEPEVLMDGEHDIATCQYWTQKVLTACYTALVNHNVLLEGTLLKPNMILPGKQSGTKASPQECALRTVRCLQRTVPAAVPGITFLSGGQSEEEATLNLNAMNQLANEKRPWQLSFSYGRALQQSTLKAWLGKPENVEAAQKVFLARAKANSQARSGSYKGDAATEESLKESYVANYTY